MWKRRTFSSGDGATAQGQAEDDWRAFYPARVAEPDGVGALLAELGLERYAEKMKQEQIDLGALKMASRQHMRDLGMKEGQPASCQSYIDLCKTGDIAKLMAKLRRADL